MYLPSIRTMGGREMATPAASTISLGRNPSKGGRPPKDKRVMARIILVEGVIDLEEAKSLGVSILFRCIYAIKTAKWSM